MSEDLPAQTGALTMVVDDDPAFRQTLARALRRRGYQVVVAEDYPSALVECREWQPERAIVDLRMPGRGGIELVESLVRSCPGIRIVVLTGFGSIDTAVEAMRAGAIHYLTKPSEIAEILAAFEGRDAPSKDGYTPSLAEVEWDHIQRVLAECAGNVSEAARRLGMHRRSLQRKLARGEPEEGS